MAVVKAWVKKPVVGATPIKGATKGAVAKGAITKGAVPVTKGGAKGYWVPAQSIAPANGGSWKSQGKGKNGGGGGGQAKTARTVPKDFEFDGEARYTGTVAMYYKFKGYGFVEFDTKGVVPGDKLFVLWKSIKSEDRFPFLVKGQQVEFGIGKRRGQGSGPSLHAKEVTLPGGENVAVQDEQDAQKEFVGGQHLRYTGTLKFYSPEKGFGYIAMDEGYAVDDDVPKEIRVETAEVNAGGRQPRPMKDRVVEFGIWKTKKGAYKAYNMTLPGGTAILQENLENRKVLEGRTYKGTIENWLWKQGFGFISGAPGTNFPGPVNAKLAEMAAAAEAKGKERTDAKQLYFRKMDCEGFKIEKGAQVTFKLYTDDRGAGACEVRAS